MDLVLPLKKSSEFEGEIWRYHRCSVEALHLAGSSSLSLLLLHVLLQQQSASLVLLLN